MNGSRRRAVVLALLTLTGVLGARSYAGLPDLVLKGVVWRWTAPSAQAARRLVDEYGLPDDVTPNRITWVDKGLWKRTVVRNQGPIYRSLDDMNVVEQTIEYPVSLRQAAKLLAFRDSLAVDMATGELSSRSSREEVNFLTMNLADEIVRGIKTAAEARTTYARVLSLEASGKRSHYMTGLLFLPRSSPRR